MGQYNEKDVHDLVCKLDSLERKFYAQDQYKVILPDKLSYVVTQVRHKLLKIKGYTFLDSNGKEVGISFKVNADKSVTIESNKSLLNCTLILF